MRAIHALALPILFAAACGSSVDGPPPGDDDPAADPDAGDVEPQPDGATPGGGATLAGSLSRSAAPDGDGIGHVYVALFDRDPVFDMENAQVVARALIENADLSADGATVAYELADIPPRAEDYFLVAFLDDNGNVDVANPDDAGPDRGDLVSLDGLAAPAVAVTATGEQAHDIVLNSVLPF